jgi:hypothetical protein
MQANSQLTVQIVPDDFSNIREVDLKLIELAKKFEAVRGTAGWTGETAAWSEVDLDVEPVCLGVKVAAADRPRRDQTQRLLQQTCVVIRRGKRTPFEG